MQPLDGKIAELRAFKEIMSGMNDFEILNVPQNCDDSAVRAGYFGRMKKFSADFFHGSPADIMEDVNIVNKRLREAYEHLQTAEKRQAALKTLEAPAPAYPQASSADATNNDPIDIEAVFAAEQAMSRAITLMERGDFQMARKYLDTAQQKDPAAHELDARIAYADFMLLELDEKGHRPQAEVMKARRILDKAASEWPKADYIRLYQGDLEKLEGNDEKALEFYKAANTIQPSPAAQQEIKLIEKRLEARKNTPQTLSFIDKLKSAFQGLTRKA